MDQHGNKTVDEWTKRRGVVNTAVRFLWAAAGVVNNGVKDSVSRRRRRDPHRSPGSSGGRTKSHGRRRHRSQSDDHPLVARSSPAFTTAADAVAPLAIALRP